MEIFEYIKGYIHAWQFLHPTNHPKIIPCLWKRYSISQSYLCFLKYILSLLTKLLLKLFLSCLLIFLSLCSVLIVLSPPKYPTTVTGPLNGCGIVWIWLCPLDHILKFSTKLLVKVRFRDFRIFLRLYSRLTIFASQKTTRKIITDLRKRHGISKSYFFLFKIHVKVFDKIVSSVIFVIFAIIFKVIFSFDNVCTSKTPKNWHRSLRWVWHCLNLSMSGVFIKICDKIFSFIYLFI